MIPRAYIGVGDVACDPATYAGCTPAQIQALIVSSPEYKAAVTSSGGCPAGFSMNTAFPGGGVCVDQSGRPISLTDAQTLALIQAARDSETPITITAPATPFSISTSTLVIGGLSVFAVLMLLAMSGGRR